MEVLWILVPAALLLIWAIWAVRQLLYVLHMLQQHSYVNRRLQRWLADDPFRFVRRQRREPKKPLVFTGRAIRILVVALVLLAIELAATVLRGLQTGLWMDAFIAAVLFVATTAWLIPLANTLLTPVQWGINRRFLKAASDRLRAVNPIVVGITGSYGKTSTKHFLHTLLSSRYRVLMTPGSYNTTMGVCRVVNEQLAPEHQVFIVEMAAYGRGEIKEIAGLVHPRIGILTAIGPQHLEWFGSIENIMATKYELIEALPADGTAVFNADDPLCRDLADRTSRVKVLQYGIASAPERLRLRAEHIRHSAQGLSFMLVDSSGGRVPVSTRLLGRHNVLNILAAGAVAMELGLSLQEVAGGIGGLQPPEHRLQLLDGAAGVTVIDDAYNANPDGAAEALEVLRQFGGRRVLVTPGMVELGSLQDHANREFGRRAAVVCDHVVLVGPAQTRPIRAGLDDAAFPSDQVTIVDSLQEAAVVLQRILKPGDAVLFENDLPDIYAES